MRVLLVSTYELGHQPWHLASPAAALAATGHEVRTLDLAVEPWDEMAVAWADGVGFSVPITGGEVKQYDNTELTPRSYS